MARTTQFIGLSPGALTHVAKSTQHYPSPESAIGMFGEEIPLCEYEFPDGKVLQERVQCEQWHSGPMIFTALKGDDGQWVPEFMWTTDEMEKVIRGEISSIH